jgi:LysR family transcriptional regulator, low CO2-responsive transcriptional regulator
VISEAAIELELATRRVVVLDVEGFPLIRHWYIVRLAQKRPTPPTQAFLDLLGASSADAAAHS